MYVCLCAHVCKGKDKVTSGMLNCPLDWHVSNISPGIDLSLRRGSFYIERVVVFFACPTDNTDCYVFSYIPIVTNLALQGQGHETGRQVWEGLSRVP